MSDELLKAKIRKLAQVSERNDLLGSELSGYLKDEVKAKIFREHAVHRVKPKKKYTYIDYGVESNQSGKFLVENEGVNKGIVWGIRGYGKRGHYVGQIDEVIKKIEKNNLSLVNGILEKTKGKSFVVKTSDSIIIHDKDWGY